MTDSNSRTSSRVFPEPGSPSTNSRRVGTRSAKTVPISPSLPASCPGPAPGAAPARAQTASQSSTSSASAARQATGSAQGSSSRRTRASASH
ncbi:hypothetical protein [Streptomyces sp. NPDC093544]|uniref:hypothetical protein n=1 Tax=Streptomyces sp. NPDC093544 TaxID=3155200 RepID=UPI003412A7FC